MIRLNLSSRELVALYLELLNNPDQGNMDILMLQERISRRLCEALSIEQFEKLDSLYDKGYEFNELHR